MKAMRPEVVMYATAFCGYCSAARRLLEGKGVAYAEIDVMFDAAKRKEMIARSGRRTVPQIFIGGRHVGGFDELAALEKRGDLGKLLQNNDLSETFEQ